MNRPVRYAAVTAGAVCWLLACGSGSSNPESLGGVASAGSGGVAGGVAGASAGTAGSAGSASPSSGSGGAASAGQGSLAGAGTSGGAGGAASGAAGGGNAGTATAGGASGSGGSGVAGVTGGGGVSGPLGTAGGTFVMCDDHADFNGRGRCAATGKVGAVFAFENLTAGAALSTLTATFGSTTPPSDVGCTTESLGGCAVLTCPHNATPGAAGPAAGVITAKSSGGVLTTTPGANGSYDVGQLPSPLWTPMAALAFSAAGGATPAFGETFCGPTGATITAPAGPPSALTIDRASDLQAKWTGSMAGDLEFVFRDDTSNAAARVEVQCFFTTASGQGTIGKAALAKIGAGQHTLASYNWVRKIGGGGTGICAELTAIMTNASSAGASVPFNGTATFQ